MDWLQRPREQAQKLFQAIKDAQEVLRNEGVQKRDVAVPVEIVTIERGGVAELSLEALSETTASFYKEAALTAVPTYQDLPSTSLSLLAKFVEDVVAVEGPVHRDEVVVRIRSAWNLLRSGGRIQTALDMAIQKAIDEGLVVGGDFLQIEGKESVPRNRSLVNSPGLRRIEMLPPTEIDAGILSVIRRSMGGTTEQLVQVVSRMLGFKSTSSQLRDLINGRKQSLVANGKLTESDGMLRIAP
ncbi:MAG TPA: DUF3320 domain-containing protein [Terriglobales bacterium]|nr:DUF3320 domain-containing protein [Terriglobales bacterium]